MIFFISFYFAVIFGFGFYQIWKTYKEHEEIERKESLERRRNAIVRETEKSALKKLIKELKHETENFKDQRSGTKETIENESSLH